MAKNLRDIIPLNEIKLSRITRALDAREPIGTVSPERSGMSRAQKGAAHKEIQSVLSRESKKKMISWTGPHAGRYKYDADAEPSKEGSYLLRPGSHPKSKENVHRILMHVAKRFGQESFLKAKKTDDGPAKGRLHFPSKEGNTSKKVQSLGDVHYNEPLKSGSGDTKLKGANSSFTVR